MTSIRQAASSTNDCSSIVADFTVAASKHWVECLDYGEDEITSANVLSYSHVMDSFVDTAVLPTQPKIGGRWNS